MPKDEMCFFEIIIFKVRRSTFKSFPILLHNFFSTILVFGYTMKFTDASHIIKEVNITYFKLNVSSDNTLDTTGKIFFVNIV